MRLLVGLAALLGWLATAVAWNLTLLHVNDMHARMEEVNVSSSNCKPRDQQAGRRCLG